MSEPTPILAPQPTPYSSNTLAPPPTGSRSNSAASNRSNTSSSSRRGRTHGSSNVSRSNSHSSNGGSEGNPNRVKKSGPTTTISGGIRLGPKDANGEGKKEKTGAKKSGTSSPNPQQAKPEGDRPKAESKPEAESKRKNGANARKPAPINTTAAAAPPRPNSSNSSAKVKSATSAPANSADSAPKSLHAAVSAPKTALQAARDAASKKQQAAGGGDALSSLQKMISDLKAIPATSASSSSATAGNKANSAKEASPAASAVPKSAKSNETSSPVPIPSSSTSTSSSKKLKADAPSFTPSFQASVSPVASQAAISPADVTSPPWSDQHPRSTSHGSAADRRASSSSVVSQNPYLSATTPFAQPLPQYAAYGTQHLHVHPEAENEDLSPMSFAHHPDGQYQQQQLLAAQQYQQLQYLQAQLAATTLQLQQQQQQQQQTQPMGSFIAPRFQALAAQRAAQQQQQQVQALAQARQLYELQQQQMLEYQRREDEARSRAIAEATLQNPPPVFEEDSPEPKPASLGPTGRPQLAPSFTFGKKTRGDSVSGEQVPMSPSREPPVINRSEGIGGAAATGLAGLAARAHKRTGSELSPAVQQQLEIQAQIEALQAKQKALMEAEKPTGSSLSDLAAYTQKQTPSQMIARHRRVQSTIPSATLNETFSAELTSVQEGGHSRQSSRAFDGMPPPPVPNKAEIGHGRRHSVNVFNKTSGHGAGFNSISAASVDIPEDDVVVGGREFRGSHHRSGSRGSGLGLESGNWRSSSGSISLPQGAPTVADLAAAQAQLQSLAQFRAAAGGGHTKMASFSFPNMLPNLLAATTLSTPAGQSLWQQQQAFQMQLQQSSSGPQRKSLFAPYLPQASLPPLLSAGKLVVGVLRVNKKNRSDAYVATDVLEADIYICGSKDRNRALEGDIVAVELLDVDEVWSTKKDKEEKKRKKEENAAYDLKPAQAKKLEKKKDDVEVEGQGLTLFEDEEVNDETKPTYAGHVVAVVERMPGQLFSGQLGVLRPSSAATKEKQELERKEREGDRGKKDDKHDEARPKIVWFKPTDKRVPLIAIPTEQAPPDFIENPDTYVDRLFVATIKRWPITSLHPFGTLVEELGPIGNCEVETSALLKDCNFPTEEFAEVALKCLPPLPWSIPEREYEIRKDLRGERIFTIDPPTAKDLDDALSIKTNEDGTYTVGVHIADVSYFVKANTALDREARKRATSVYLVQRAVPMLPPQLSEELCSLQPNVERLAFSATFTIDKEGDVLKKEFGRTIIKSCGKLAYDDAFAVLNGSTLDESKITTHNPTDVAADIKALHTLATQMRAKRSDNGAMMSSKNKMLFKLDDQGKPTDCFQYSKTDANVLVEEFMLLANLSVARVIAGGLPEQSLLRRHEGPLERRIENFVAKANKLGFEFDGVDQKLLQKGFDKIQTPEDALVLELLKRKAMQRARYFCTGMLDIAKYSHWALNAPVYTHFTSPIRRYADVLVHRMLDACLASPNPTDVKFHMDRDQVAKCAQQCNMKKQSAKLAEDQSVHLYLCMLIHDLTERYGPVVREARVTNVLDAAFDVVVPEFGIEKRVHVDKMPLNSTVFDEHKDVLSLYWTSQDVLTYLASTSDDPHLVHIKSIADRPQGSNSASDGEGSAQRERSAQSGKVDHAGLRTSGGHKIQDVKELMKVHVIVTSDMTKSPPVLVVYACNPYAQ